MHSYKCKPVYSKKYLWGDHPGIIWANWLWKTLRWFPSTGGVYTGFHVGQIPWLTRDQCRMQSVWHANMVTPDYLCSGDRTVDAMVCQIWHEPLVNLSRHRKTGSIFFGELHQLGYRWHYVSSLSLMILHTSFLAFCCTPASAYTRNKVTINMVLTCIVFYMWRHT